MRRSSRSRPALPEGPEQALTALSQAMLRGAALPALGTTAAAIAVAWAFAGLAGAVSALAGGVLAMAASLITLVLIRRTATLHPSAVMVASFGGMIAKAIVLLVGLFGAGMIDGVHRESLAVTVLVVLIAVTAGEGWASHRTGSPIIDPVPVAVTPATSGSLTGMAGSAEGGPVGTDGRPVNAPSAHDHEQ